MNILPVAGRTEILVINVFSVPPANQQQVINRIQQAGTPESVSGLLAMHLLRGADGTRVINHMCWESEAAFRAALADNPIITDTMHKVSALIDNGRPESYDLVPWP